MDALTKLNEHFLTCNICTETFKDPCTLGCQHTFCKGCLTKYTETRWDAITAKSIQCPNCRQMTTVPRPQEPVHQWCQQFKPSFLIQGLLDTFTSPGSSDPVEQCCFTCQQNWKTSQAKSVCEDCDINLCESCAKVHMATPMAADHVISPLGAGSTPQLKKRKVMCKEHKCLVEFCCKNCQKAVCNKCCIVYHRKCNCIVTLDSMIPEMKQYLKQNRDDIDLHIQQTENNLKRRISEVEYITKDKFSLQSEIRRVSQQAVDLIRRKEKSLLDELDVVIDKQIRKVRSQIKSGDIDLQTFQQYTEFIKQVLQSNSPMDLYDMCMLCKSGAITADIQKRDKQEKRKKVAFENQLDVDQIDRTLQLGHLKLMEDPPQLLYTVSTKSADDKKKPYPCDIEVFNIGGTETLVITDNSNSSVKSCYTKDGKPHCRYIKLEVKPFALTKLSQDRIAVSHLSHNSIELIKLTPDPVLMSSIKTKKKYTCLTALSETTLAAGCREPPSIDVLDLSGRLLRSLIKPSNDLQLIQRPLYMCTTRQGHIVVADEGSESVYCVTQQGGVLFTYKLTRGGYWGGGVTTTDNGRVIVTDYYDKIIQLTETGEYVKDLLTRRKGILEREGILVHGNKLYVTENYSEHVKIFKL